MNLILTKIDLRWIIDLYMKENIIKLLKENIGEYLHDFRADKIS